MEVLDSWFVETVQPRLEGKSFLVRYADDASETTVSAIGCEKKEDADRIMKVLSPVCKVWINHTPGKELFYEQVKRAWFKWLNRGLAKTSQGLDTVWRIPPKLSAAKVENCSFR